MAMTESKKDMQYTKNYSYCPLQMDSGLSFSYSAVATSSCSFVGEFHNNQKIIQTVTQFILNLLLFLYFLLVV